MKMIMRALMPTLLICLLAPAAVVFAQDNPPKSVSAQSDAKKAFEKLKTLAGSWEGSIMGMPVQVTIRVTSSGNAILHEGTSSGMPDNPITMLYVDNDRLLLTHYCDSGNRPRMQGKLSPDGKTVTFDFLDVSAMNISFRRSRKENDYETQRYVNHHVFALDPLHDVSPERRHRPWV